MRKRLRKSLHLVLAFFLFFVGAAAENVALVSGTGTVCATSIAAVPGVGGGTTAATGFNLAANGGLTFGNGASSIAETDTDADNLCLLQAGSVQVSGGFTYVSL